MRCHICDRALADTEVIFNKDLIGRDGRVGAYEPCSTCLDIAMDAAFSQGFQGGDEENYEELGDDDLGSGEVETLDRDAFNSEPDQYRFSFESDRYD